MCTNNCCLKREITLNLLTVDQQNFVCEVTTGSGVARLKLMVGPDYRGTKEVLEDLVLAAPV